MFSITYLKQKMNSSSCVKVLALKKIKETQQHTHSHIVKIKKENKKFQKKFCWVPIFNFSLETISRLPGECRYGQVDKCLKIRTLCLDEYTENIHSPHQSELKLYQNKLLIDQHKQSKRVCSISLCFVSSTVEPHSRKFLTATFRFSLREWHTKSFFYRHEKGVNDTKAGVMRIDDSVWS